MATHSTPAGPGGPKTTPLRSLLPRLDGGSVALRNRAYAAPACALHGGRVLIWQDSGVFDPTGVLHCRLGSSTLDLAADSLGVLEPSLEDFEPFVPPQACTALVEHAMAPLLDLIEKLAGRPLVCEEFQRPEPDAAGLLRIGFVLLGPARQIEVRGWARADPSVWRSLDFSRGPALPSSRFHAIPIELSVQLGRCRLPLAELLQLETGDALRITPRVPRQRDGLPVRLAQGSGGLACRARLKGDHLTLETPMKPSDTPTPAPAITPSTTPDDALLSGIECELSFELGHLRMSLAEIARLRVGQAVPTGVRLQDQPVRILTGGRLIARGELAALGDEVVVVLTETPGLPHL